MHRKPFLNTKPFVYPVSQRGADKTSKSLAKEAEIQTVSIVGPSSAGEKVGEGGLKN